MMKTNPSSRLEISLKLSQVSYFLLVICHKWYCVIVSAELNGPNCEKVRCHDISRVLIILKQLIYFKQNKTIISSEDTKTLFSNVEDNEAVRKVSISFYAQNYVMTKPNVFNLQIGY